MEPLSPAVVSYDERGTPFSPQYGDIYHSAAGGAGQAHHVFLNGNGLPERWRGRDSFTILETGFGLGTNFLATWQAWREDPRRPQRLHYVSVEKHPPPRAALARSHAAHTAWAACSSALLAAWPHALPGLHRLEFESGGVILTLAYGDVAAMLPALDLGADALYLDGFGPEHNPDMWTSRVAKALSRLAREDCTLATYTCARDVRDALESAGFRVAKAPGHGAKRDMLTGRYAPRATYSLRRHAPRAARRASERRALVIGAGLAGAAVCERLRARGWAVEVISCPPGTSSVLPAAVFHSHLSPDDCLLSRWARAGTLYSQRRWQALEHAGLSWRRCGALQVDDAAAEQPFAWIQGLGLPAEYAQAVTRAEAARRLGHDAGRGGLWLADAGWVHPAALNRAQLDGISRHIVQNVDTLSREDGLWAARDTGRGLIASAPVAVLANAGDAARLCDSGVPLSAIGGRITLARGDARLQAVICGDGYAAPLDDQGRLAVGASYETEGPLTANAADAGNLARLSRLLPGMHATVAGGAHGVRSVARDRMPVIGALPDRAAIDAQRERLRGAPLQALPRLPGLYGAYAYGSRGLAWAALGAELIACDLEGEPAPVERALLDAADPARFLLKALRHAA